SPIAIRVQGDDAVLGPTPRLLPADASPVVEQVHLVLVRFADEDLEAPIAVRVQQVVLARGQVLDPAHTAIELENGRRLHPALFEASDREVSIAVDVDDPAAEVGGTRERIRRHGEDPTFSEIHPRDTT